MSATRPHADAADGAPATGDAAAPEGEVSALEARVAAVLADPGGGESSAATDALAEHDDTLAARLAARLDSLADGDARELHRLARVLAKDGVLSRLRALERVQAAADRLAEAGPVSEIVDRAPAAACQAIGLDRAVLSRIDDGRLVAEAAHCVAGAGDGAATLAALREAPVRLGYPLLEAEMLRRRRAVVVGDPGEGAAARHAFADVMRWGQHVATPVVLEGRVIGFLHGDRIASGAPLGAADRDALWRFALHFAQIFERAVLRRRLRIQRQELREVASWANARTSELSDGVIDLAVERDAAAGEEPARAQGPDSALRDLLTRRELDVLEHMVRGETNADIARSLVVSEGTVKFHVKNILRKLHASNRAEATSRYLHMSLRGGGGEAARRSWPAS
ncbi:MAG: LuxR family transcriptional regulator, regulator of acetate metabolism [Solirubrobacteraceae bacterium]|nr:LuxR family transcriptional regulator, regulator of acetate metabolism [Solirubrobacteraceae bacterium]